MNLRTYIALRKIAADTALKAAGERSVPPQAKPDASQGPAPINAPVPAAPQTSTQGNPQPQQPEHKPFKAGKLGPGEGYYRTKSGGYAVASHDTAKTLGWTPITDTQNIEQTINRARAANNPAVNNDPAKSGLAKPLSQQEIQQIQNERQIHANQHKEAPHAYVGEDFGLNVRSKLGTDAILARRRTAAPGASRPGEANLRVAVDAANKSHTGFAGYPELGQALGETRLLSEITREKQLQSMRTDLTPEQQAQAQRDYRMALNRETEARNRAREYRGLGIAPGTYSVPQQAVQHLTPEYWQGLGMYNPQQPLDWSMMNNG